MLWHRGIETWTDFICHEGIIFSPARDRYIQQELILSSASYKDISFFERRLLPKDMWRLFEAFRNRTAYVDIETSGGYQGLDEVTVIGLYDGKQVHSFVNGVNLDDFEVAIADYDLMVTFNGASFDIPIIRRWFRTISLPPAHIDLCRLLRRLGHRGGLKKIEKAFGLSRDSDIDGMDGYEAVALWKAHQWGDPDALDILLRYNRADIVNLEPLMQWGYREMKSRLFSDHSSLNAQKGYSSL